MNKLDLLASEAYQNYWLCILNAQPSTAWQDLPDDVKETWRIVVQSILINSLNMSIVFTA